jgi:uncharacterized membrane protein YkvA (DUF1232 family)
MSAATWLVVSLGALAAVYAVFILGLLLLGRRENARAIAGFVPDCTVLLTRLMREPGLPRRRWFVLILATGYLAMPLDLVPDFLPVVGYLDDAIVVALVLRWLLRTIEPQRLQLQWPGPDSSLQVVLRLAGVPRTPPEP